MSGVSSAESAALVLRYLESSAFRRTAGTFRREASKLLKSIVTPPTVKPLSDILDEYVKLKEADSQRKRLVQANPLVGDLLAVLASHAGKPSTQHKPADMQNAPSSAEQQLSEPQLLPASDQPPEVDMLACEPSFSQMDGMATDQHAIDATPAPQQADPQFAKRLATSLPRPQSSSQHRKGAPRRRAGDGSRDAAAPEWMNLPMTEDGFSSLMQDDSFQQRFAEGLAMHLTSGAELGTNASNHYDALLASLPADPAMAGLLEPLVLPADAYQIPADAYQIPADACHIPADPCQIPADACQIPAETHNLLAAYHHLDRDSGANQHQNVPQTLQTASDPARALESSATLCGQNPVEASHMHAPGLQQSMRDQQQSADQLTCLDAMQRPQLATASCQSLHHQHSGEPCPPQLQQPQQHKAVQAMSLQLHPPPVFSSTLPVQQPANPLSIPAAASKPAAEQSSAHVQDATTFHGQGKLAMPIEGPAGSVPHQLQGMSASMCLPAADEHGAQQGVRGSMGSAAEAAALDSMYATIFPDRQTAKASSGTARLSSTSEANLGNLPSSTAAHCDPVPCNVSDPLPVATAVPNPTGLISKKRRRSSVNAQPASVASSDQHSSAMFCGSEGAGAQCVRPVVAQQQQPHQAYKTGTAAPAQVKGAQAQTDAMAAELGNADCSPSKQQLHRPVLASLPSNQFVEAPPAAVAIILCKPLLSASTCGLHAQPSSRAGGAGAGTDSVQPEDAAQQKVFGRGQNTASFSAAAIEEFLKTLHGKS